MLTRAFACFAFIVAASANAAAQERQWNFDVSDEQAYLVFGVPESDDVGVSFWCTLRTGKVNLFLTETDATLRVNQPTKAVVFAGRKKFKIKGKTVDNEEAGSISFETEIATSHPLFAELLKQDRFKVRVGRDEIVYPLVDANLQGLLEACKAR